MKKYLKLIVLICIFLMSLFCISSCVNASNIKSIDIDNIDFSSISEDKANKLKEILGSVDINTIISTDDTKGLYKSSISINTKEIANIYDKISDVISNEEIANLLEDNSEMLTNTGLDSNILDTSTTLLRTFNSDAVINLVEEDLDFNSLLKLLLSNVYVKVGIVISIIIAIYSVFITSLIFGKAGKKKFATVIPIYRDIVHLKVCGLSPWLLLLAFIPILGWVMLMSVAIIGRFELSKKFGHGFFFGLGLLVFPLIFRSIIAFSKNEYIEDLYKYNEDEDEKTV